MDSIDNTITNILEPTRNRGDVNYLDLSEEESYNLDVNDIISDSIIREVEQRVEEANNQAVDITNELIGSEFFIKNVSLIEFCEHVSDVFDLIDTEIPLRGQALLLDKTTYSSDSQGRVIICDPRMILPIGKSEFNTTIRTKCSVSDKLINKGFFIKITNADGGMICFVSFKSDEKNYVLYKIIDGTYFFYGIGSVGISCPIPNYIDPENMILNGLIKYRNMNDFISSEIKAHILRLLPNFANRSTHWYRIYYALRDLKEALNNTKEPSYIKKLMKALVYISVEQNVTTNIDSTTVNPTGAEYSGEQNDSTTVDQQDT